MIRTHIILALLLSATMLILPATAAATILADQDAGPDARCPSLTNTQVPCQAGTYQTRSETTSRTDSPAPIENIPACPQPARDGLWIGAGCPEDEPEVEVRICPPYLDHGARIAVHLDHGTTGIEIRPDPTCSPIDAPGIHDRTTGASGLDSRLPSEQDGCTNHGVWINVPSCQGPCHNTGLVVWVGHGCWGPTIVGACAGDTCVPPACHTDCQEPLGTRQSSEEMIGWDAADPEPPHGENETTTCTLLEHTVCWAWRLSCVYTSGPLAKVLGPGVDAHNPCDCQPGSEVNGTCSGCMNCTSGTQMSNALAAGPSYCSVVDEPICWTVRLVCHLGRGETLVDGGTAAPGPDCPCQPGTGSANPACQAGAQDGDPQAAWGRPRGEGD